MKKFSFGLDSVLDHRRWMEETEQQKLMKIHQAILQAQEQKENLQVQAKEYREMMIHRKPGVIDLSRVRHLTLYLKKLDHDILQLSQQITKLEEEKQLQREKVVEARKRREILEKLREKSFAHHQLAMQGMEQKLLDELASVQFKQSDE